MKKAYFFTAAACLAMMTGCSNADENGNKNRTTTPAKTVLSEQVSSEQESSTEVTNVSEDESTGTETTVPVTTQEPDRTEDSSGDESSSETDETTTEKTGQDIPQETVKIEKNRISSKSYGIDVSYPDGWVIKSYNDRDENYTETIASASNEDLGVTSTVELVTFDESVEEGRKVSTDEFIENLKQAYTEMTSSDTDPDDPMRVTDVSIEDGSSGKARTILLSYTQRNVKTFFYTFVFRESEEENHFMVFSYAYSDSENAQRIKTALEEMMGE